MSLPPSADNYVGEPQYPLPWTTNRPREGLRDNNAARIVSLSPDVCKTPIGSATPPIPYPVVDFCGHDENYTESVLFTGQKVMVLRSNTCHVHGDKPGKVGGVKSGTVEGICEPIEGADLVRAEGSPIITHLHRCHMNNKNTVGEAYYTCDTNTYPAPKDDDPVSGSLKWPDKPIQLAANGSAAPFLMARSGAQPAIQPSPEPDPVPKPPGEVVRPNFPQWNRQPPLPRTPIKDSLLRLGRFGRFAGGVGAFIWGMWPTSTAMPWHDELPQTPFEEQLFKKARELEDAGVDADDINDWFQNERRKQRETQTEPSPQPQPLPDNVRVDEKDRRCPWIMICFMPKQNVEYDPQEFEKQVQDQGNALNRFSPDEYIVNRTAVGAVGSTEPFRNTKAAKDAYSKLWAQYNRDNPGYPSDGSMAALHQLDIVAGGYGDRFLRVGPSRENSIIGSLWSQGRGVKGGDRLKRLDDHARLLKANNCPRMNARLQVCPSNATEVPAS